MPAETVAVDIAVKAPPEPIVYCEMVPLPEFATYAYLPEGSTVMEFGLVPVVTVAVDIGDNAPSVPILYCETLLLP